MQEYHPPEGPVDDPAPLASAPGRATAPLPAHAPAPANRPRGGSLMVVLMLLLGLLAGSIGGGATAWTLAQTSAAPAATARTASAATPQPVANANANLIGGLYTKVASSVVDIQTVIGGNRRVAGSGEGTGIVLDASHVLTNYHVVQGASSIKIVLQDGTSVTATVTGSDQQADLAVLSASLPADKVQAATLGDSDSVQVGDEVVAIGSPFGLDHTVTAGIVSAVNRDWSSGNAPAQAMIQTDAPINPGNSGGPLFNLQGQVIGVNNAIESPVDGSVGVGFAIPINRVKDLLPTLLQGT